MTQDSSGRANKNVVLIIATITVFVVPFLVSSINIALPGMSSELHMEAVVMTWVNTIYFVAVATSQVPMGRLADIYGRKKIFFIGLMISLVSSLAAALADSVALLLVSRAFQGFGIGMLFNTIVAILTSVFPPEERGKALGINLAGMYCGISLGPFIGGLLVDELGWRSIFFFSACSIALLVPTVLIFFKGEWYGARGEKFDVPGSIVFGVAMAAFMYGFSTLPGWTALAFLLAGAAGLAYFISRQLKSPHPMLDVGLFKSNPVFLFSNLATFLCYVATFAVAFLLSLYLQHIKGMTPDHAGLALIASSVPMMLVTLLAGRLSDRIEAGLVATGGMVVVCAALVMFIFLNDATPLWYVILGQLVYGTGIGLFSSPNANAIMGSVEKKFFGVASGIVGTMRTAGMMLSLGIMMILFSVFIGQAEITPEFYPQFVVSIRVGFIVFTVLGTGGLLAQVAGRKKTGGLQIPRGI